jgi:hypothetical protein
VLGWRRTQLELEEYRLRQLSAELEGIQREKARLAAERTLAERELLGRAQWDGEDLAAHSAFLSSLGQQERRMKERELEQERRIAAQHERVLEARRNCRLLERLRARAWNAWQAEADRETEALAAEAHLARWGRERKA